MIEPPNWIELFADILERGEESLQWGLPEGWFHAELYRELKNRAATSRWDPLPDEIPYVTCYPVRAAKQSIPVKWVDLSVCAASGDAWCWFELKVRRTPDPRRKDAASRQARDAFRKDVVALMGFNLKGTVNIWATAKPSDNFFSSHVNEPLSRSLLTSRHYFSAAFLQIDGALDAEVWNNDELNREISKWLSYRQRSSCKRQFQGPIEIGTHTQTTIRSHSLVLCQWHIDPKDYSSPRSNS